MQNSEEKGYKKLEVWRKSHQFLLGIYKHTKDFPKNEEYGLVSQLRRAALSIPTNIVEGQASTSKKDFLNFLNIANRSLVETEYLLGVACELSYLAKDEFEELEKMRFEIGLMLHSLSRSIRDRL